MIGEDAGMTEIRPARDPGDRNATSASVTCLELTDRAAGPSAMLIQSPHSVMYLVYQRDVCSLAQFEQRVNAAGQ
jgi:hypothetical protein